MRRKEESMEEQNRANEEKDRNPQILETERERVKVECLELHDDYNTNKKEKRYRNFNKKL